VSEVADEGAVTVALAARVAQLAARLQAIRTPTAAAADEVVREVSAIAGACEAAGIAGPAALARGVARIADDGTAPAERIAFLTAGVGRLAEFFADLTLLSGEAAPQPAAAAPEAAAAAPHRAPAEAEPAPVAEEAGDGESALADPELLPAFVAEAAEHLESSEPHLLTLEADPSNREALDAVFRSFHSVKGTAGFVGLSGVVSLAHEAESLLDRARDGSVTLIGAAFESALAALDALREMVDRVRDSGRDEPLTPAGRELVARLRSLATGKPEAAAPTRDVSPARPDGPGAAATGSRDEAAGADAESASAEEKQPSRSAAAGGAAKAAAAEQMRVDRGRLDRLVDLIGELVIAESMAHAALLRAHGHAADADDDRTFGQLRKITRELQELSLSLRMVPVGGLFPKMTRLVRDLSHKLGKPVDLVTEGGETELDKTVIDQVADPLMHLVRNSLDHGIESTPADRAAAGKPERATIRLRAFHRGGDIHIELTDDGRGLDRKRIAARAIERGLIATAEGMSDREIDQLIFAPGFSTAEKVSEVSGRGVGMDVVRRNIEALQGSVTLASEPGRGTTVTLRLPLTLAIVDGMVVRVGSERYILPTLSVLEQLRPKPSMLAAVGGRTRLVAVRGRNVPFHSFRDVFGRDFEPGDAAADGIIVLVEDRGRLAGLLVDEVIGQQQVVIKSLGESLEGLPGIAGGAVLPDGRVGVILDVPGLLDLASGGPGAARRAG
jgi:two-component system chemotaxis sensor kinase CheA